MTYSTIQKKVMRRVWRLYVQSVVVSPAAVVGALTMVSAAAFAQLVFVEQVISNMLATNVGQLPAFTVSAVTQTDTPTLVAFVALCASSLWGMRLVGKLSRLTWARHTVTV